MPPSLWSIVRRKLDQIGCSQQQRLNAIINGRRAVSADTALLLEGLTRWDAEIWLRLQAKWDL